MKTFFVIIVLLLSTDVLALAEQDKIIIGGVDGIDPYDSVSTHEIVMALSGGGARGLASIGVIRAFEEKNLRIKAITGTSMGGVVGGLYACGYSPEELSTIVNNLDFNEFFVDAPARETMFLTQRQESESHLISIRFDSFKPVIPKGWTGGQKITTVLNRLTTKSNYECGGDFTKLQIPFKTVATDVISGQEIIIDHGSISEAMRATMAFPLALTAVESNGYMLMDGGMVTPIPVTIAKQMNDDDLFVVAINTASKLASKEEIKTPVDIAGQVTTIMTADRLAAQLKAADFVLEPPLGNFESADFDYKDSLIEIGYNAGIKAADSIIKIIDKRGGAFEMTVTEIEISNSNSSLKKEIQESLAKKTFSKKSLIRLLREFALKHQIFQLEATITPQKNQSGKNNVSIELSVYECPKVNEYEFEILGATLYPIDTLAKIFVNGNDCLTSSEFKNGIELIEKRYHHDGYDVAFVRLADIDFTKKKIKITIDEAIVQGIDVEENKRTLDWLVRSYFPLRVGQPYSTKRAAAGLDNLYGTDLFEQIMLELTPYRDSARVKIKVKERYYTQLRLGWHWDDDYKSEQFVELLDDNIRGMGLEYMLHAQYAEDHQKYFGQLKMDRIWFTYMTARINAYHERINKSLYDSDGKEIDLRKERRTGFEFSLGQQVKRFGTVQGSFTLERIRNRFQKDPAVLDFNQRVLELESIIETFDKLPYPNTGKKLQTEFSYAGKFLGGEVQYTKFYSSLEAYLPIGKYVNFHPKVSLGLSGSELPISEQYFIGGAKSFSGYRAFEYAGDKLVLLNNELRFKLPLSLYLIGRYDIGEVYIHTQQIKLRNLRHGGGAFLAFDSPLGPFEIGYGAADSDNDRFYVNIGLTF